MLKTVKKVINHPVKIVYGFEKLGLLDWLKDETYLKIIYRLEFKRKLNLENPRAYTEKLAWYKLHWRSKLAKSCADKYSVREYIKDKIGPEYLIDNYGCWDKFEDIDFDQLPNQFVLKPTNGCGDVVICKDKSNFDIESARKKLNKYRNRHFSSKTKEWVYYDLPYRIIAERLLTTTDGSTIKDYKFFCFYGKPQFLIVCSDRDVDVNVDFYDLDWNWMPVSYGHGNNPIHAKPGQFNKMLNIARILSQDFPHVRVDLYNEKGRIYCGELTFYHNGGISRYKPDKWDYQFGDLFDLKKIPSNQLA